MFDIRSLRSLVYYNQVSFQSNTFIVKSCVKMAAINSLEISLDSSFESLSELTNNKTSQEFEEINSNNPLNEFVNKIMLCYLRHNLTLVCLEDIMKLINNKPEDCDKLPTSKKQIIKLFRKHRDLNDVFYFVNCDKCKRNTKVDSQNSIPINCEDCKSVLKTTETNFFVSMPIEQQIISSLKDNWSYISEFCTSIDKDLDKDTKCYSDAHDGAILKNVLNQYADSDVNILSMCLNLDGANKFKSNLLSVWPTQLIQNYLPPSIRFQPNNLLVSGLHYNKEKPNCFNYLLPLINELDNFKEHSIDINIEGQHYKFKPVITHCSVDLPAKSLLQEIKQYGGYDSCTFCDITGELIEIENLNANDDEESTKKTTKNKKNKTKNNTKNMSNDKKPKKFIRYVEGNESHELRDEEETLSKMLVVSSSRGGKDVDGIKGVSCLVGLEHFNIVFSMSPEYMHGCLLGATKRLVNFLCNSKYKNKPFYISPTKRKLLNSRILAIKPTANIVRKPRSLEQRKHFKASEFGLMLLHYLPVCLPGCVPRVYVEHIRTLSAALYTLLKTNISTEEVDNAEKMLYGFVKEHQDLFGKENMVMVIHLLQHLSESVRQLGPLWSHSAFPFERNNGCLLNLVNGTTDVLKQISTKYTLLKSLSRKDKMANTSSDNQIFHGKSIEIVEKSLNVYNLDTSKILNLSNVLLRVYKRIKLGKVIYTSLLYTRPKKSIDYFIGLKDDTIGMAKFYFEYKETQYVIMERFEIIDYVNHILKVQKTGLTIMARIDAIEKKHIFIKVGIHQYISCPPNPYENE